MAIASLSNPFIAFVFVIYAIICFGLRISQKKNEIFNLSKLKWLTIGIMVLFIPFCIILMLSGTVSEYITNISFILSDSEHSEYSIIEKMIRSQYQILRVYWRVWVPLFITSICAFYVRNSEKYKKAIYIISCVIVAYGTIRFAFIYGSVSINLMLTPFMFLGLFVTYLIIIWNYDIRVYYNDIIWFLFGYIFSVMNYLATNTEILSMSAMMIISAIASIRLNIKIVSKELELNSFICKTFAYLTIVLFLMSLFILRMTFMWGDLSITKCTSVIDKGIAVGIKTSKENKDEYDNIFKLLDEANINSDDKVLFIPTNALYYLMTDGEIAAPYVVRFNTELSELKNYYDTHAYKVPDKIVIFKNDEYENIINYFLKERYEYSIMSDEFCVLEKSN
ncbi:MAG: hypothetical protein IJR29_09075 [Butyrivibrio sp.]|nr:hypothetical protein [Butyrivibrio sp.]